MLYLQGDIKTREGGTRLITGSALLVTGHVAGRNAKQLRRQLAKVHCPQACPGILLSLHRGVSVHISQEKETKPIVARWS